MSPTELKLREAAWALIKGNGIVGTPGLIDGLFEAISESEEAERNEKPAIRNMSEPVSFLPPKTLYTISLYGNPECQVGYFVDVIGRHPMARIVNAVTRDEWFDPAHWRLIQQGVDEAIKSHAQKIGGAA